MSLTGQVGPFLLFGVAAHLITSADMALMMGSAPIFTFLLARMFGLGEVWNARAAAGLALGLVGVALSLGSPFAGERRGARRAGARPRAGRARSATPAARCCRDRFRARSARRWRRPARWRFPACCSPRPNSSPAGRRRWRRWRRSRRAARGAGRARPVQYRARLLRLFPPDRNGGRDLRRAQQLRRSLHRRDRRRAGAWRTGQARGLDRPRLRAGQRRGDRLRSGRSAQDRPIPRRPRPSDRIQRRRGAAQIALTPKAATPPPNAKANEACGVRRRRIVAPHHSQSNVRTAARAPRWSNVRNSRALAASSGSAAGGMPGRGAGRPRPWSAHEENTEEKKCTARPLMGERRLLCSSTSDRRTVNDDHLLVKGKTSCATRFFLEPPLSLSR